VSPSLVLDTGSTTAGARPPGAGDRRSDVRNIRFVHGGRHLRPEPDIIVPPHLLRRTIATPEKRLLLAVLEEAVVTYQRYVVATDRRGRNIFGDVAAWFASEDHGRLYSFVAICDALGFNPTYVRSGLGPWAAKRRIPTHDRERPPHRLSFRRVGGTRHQTTGRAEGSPRRA
jgi:hypothetical protein